MNAVAVAIILVVFINIYLLLYARGVELVSYVANSVSGFFSATGEYSVPVAVVTIAILFSVIVLSVWRIKK
ncbi:MAG: hypothetical protein HY365_03560 [Candidatus Aenigmarchaeota archaeon]|nr:hypothetical protein [Candidatus Aenigmarchaeota archaeon]